MDLGTACDDAPRGQQQVRAALIEAATTLFAERGPDAVSLREIASSAGVNYGLVHRHVGSKEALVLATFEACASALALELSDAMGAQTEAADIVPVMARHEPFWRMLTRALLDGRSLTQVLPDQPILGVMLARFTAVGGSPAADGPQDAVDEEVRLRVAAVAAAFLGWMAFGEQLVGAVGLSDIESDEAHRRFEELLRPVLLEGGATLPTAPWDREPARRAGVVAR